jgi:hypothetical protein
MVKDAGGFRGIALVVFALFPTLLPGQNKEASACPANIGAPAGSTPLIAVHSRANQPGLIVCGDLEKRRSERSVVASEFDVFQDGSDKPVLEFGALRQAEIVAHDKSLLVTEIVNWPFGPRWEWTDAPLLEYVIDTGSPPAVKQRIVLKPPKHTPSEIRAVLRKFEALRKSHTPPNSEDAIGDLIGRLMVAALGGSEEASTAFRRMGVWLCSLDPFNAEFAETYNLAVDVYNSYFGTNMSGIP